MTRTYQNFIYNEAHGFIFAYVPKVACTNWKSVLRHMAGHADYLDNRLAHDKQNGGLRYLDLTGPDSALLTDSGIRKYAFVRNPYSRTLSAYLNKIESNLPLSEVKPDETFWVKVTRNIEDHRVRNVNHTNHPSVDFETFLLWLCNSKSQYRGDEHWQKQSVLLHWPDIRFDFVGRFENLAADSRIILDAMGCEIAFPTQKEVNFSPTEADNRLENYLTKRAASLISEYFADDFANFGYATKE
jgi:hypothetical protein